MVTIISSYNRQMTPDMKAIYIQQFEDQPCFKSLNTNFPNVYELEYNFFKAAQYILTSYSDKCNRSIQLRAPSERTLWVDRIASIFQTLGDQTGLIGLNVFIKRHNEILPMEASIGLEKKDMEHTMEDMLKNLNSTIAFINGIGRKYLDASHSTFKKLHVVSVQSVKQTITLTSTRIDITKVDYCVMTEEVR
ncbi:uncharacterized protein BX663DRAFT_559519 [Cokeromyces recurvatus]|uniref:uncharacterized protein n=1 Tax=Cokeromyces recurvatus TaxID=90255 RepID=UPI002220ADD5|nr:uncharacterized protein BX663DRAFT_559519 [Cokeromyces recurvatus]KAI7904488.1 hypothetical protein BX663DRAFT_559519 [Cokeromyces recurvatus]